jgi:phosphoesterase RecJ-like protein
MTPTPSGPAAAVDRLRRARRALVTSHRSPDGDALGSELAVAELAQKLGVETEIINRDPAPSGLGELPGAESIAIQESLPETFPEAFDLVVTMECPELDRTGFDGLDRVPILNIDHHQANARYGDVNYLDEASPAVGEMVFLMFNAARLTPSADAATNMFAALSTDTGDFRYSNATPRAFLAAAKMVAAGARPERVAEWVHERRTEASIRLLGEALRTLELECDGRLATIVADPGAFERAGATPADTEDVIDVPRSIAGVQVVAFLKQWKPPTIRVSLRSKGSIDVRSVAVELGGGGHTNAAGCSTEGDPATVRKELATRLRRLLEDAS